MFMLNMIYFIQIQKINNHTGQWYCNFSILYIYQIKKKFENYKRIIIPALKNISWKIFFSACSVQTHSKYYITFCSFISALLRWGETETNIIVIVLEITIAVTLYIFMCWLWWVSENAKQSAMHYKYRN